MNILNHKNNSPVRQDHILPGSSILDELLIATGFPYKVSLLHSLDYTGLWTIRNGQWRHLRSIKNWLCYPTLVISTTVEVGKLSPSLLPLPAPLLHQLQSWLLNSICAYIPLHLWVPSKSQRCWRSLRNWSNFSSHWLVKNQSGRSCRKAFPWKPWLIRPTSV